MPIPNFLGSLNTLTYLNLSDSNFGGMIPPQLGNLSMLNSLSLRGEYDYLLSVENLEWLSGLSSLLHLDMSYVNLSQVNNWWQVINALPSLLELYFERCGLPHPQTTMINSTSLEVLDLSGNAISGPIPSYIHNLTRLSVLDLSLNQFNSTIPNWLYTFTHLQVLILWHNHLEGTISSAIGNLTSLVTLDLSDNRLQGKIPIRPLGYLCNLRGIYLSRNSFIGGEVSEVLTTFSACNMHKVESLDFESTHLYGELSYELLGQFRNLVYLNLPANSISGSIPESIGELSFLTSLDVSYNQLNGSLPQNLGKLTRLEMLYISSNALEGIVMPEVHFANLTRLIWLDARDNKLIFKQSDNWVPPFQLRDLLLGSSQLGPKFPSWLQSQKEITRLDISNTGLLDITPTWFWSKFCSKQFKYLNMSHNQIHGRVSSLANINIIDLSFNNFIGPIPLVYGDIYFLDLSNNFFSGSLDKFLCNEMEYPSNTMEFINLENNLISQGIPNCGMKWKFLISLKLGNNHLTGAIPNSIAYLISLESLHLRNNNFTGKLSPSLQNCTALKTIDLSENKFTGTIPTWIHKWSSTLVVLNLRANMLHGNIPEELCQITTLQILDLANNNLGGTIPRCFKNFTAMAIQQEISMTWLNYSSPVTIIKDNAFLIKDAKVVEYNTILNLVRSVDLSGNKLIGSIPKEITTLWGLHFLNLSVNHLTDRIPKDVGNMRSLQSLDLSMNQLNGEIPLSMSSLTFLNRLNLSYNNLTGRIPSSTQLQSFNESSFIGNNLCGPPSTYNCSKNGVTPNGRPEVDEEINDPEVDWFFICMTIGFAVGLWVVLGPLLFVASWRITYFGFLDNVWCKIIS